MIMTRLLDNKGVSVITMVVIVIVLVLIATITITTGSKTLENARKKTTQDRLEAIYTSILAHEEELGFAGSVMSNSGEEYRILNSSDFSIMGLDAYSDTSEYAPVLVKKSTTSDALGDKVEYTLKTPKQVKKSGVYDEKDYETIVENYYEKDLDSNYKVEFDTRAGVNRPILTSDMTPVRFYRTANANRDIQAPVIVDNVYSETWYDYSTDSPMWANVMIDNNYYYVWIPRFAYKIQDYYAGTDYDNIPSSAIDIVFLSGDSDYMANGEFLPSDYEVHPAFKYAEYDSAGNAIKEVNLPGFWVAKYNIENAADSLQYAVDKIDSLYAGTSIRSSETTFRLMKNSEWAAIAYLSMYSVGRVTNGNSLNDNASGVFELDKPAYVAAGLESYLPASIKSYADRYRASGDLLQYKSYEGSRGKVAECKYSTVGKYGDALIATSNQTGSWFNGTAIRPSSTAPFIIRGVDNDNIFSYSAAGSVATKIGPGYRDVLIVATK